MKNLKKLLCVSLCLLMALSLFAACGKTGGESGTQPSEVDTEATADISEAPADETDAEETDAPTAESVSRPTAEGGQLVKAYDVTLYLPEFLTANEWNGMLGVYDYYTGEYYSSRPSGMDVALSVTADSNVKTTLDDYARTETAERLGAEVTPVETELNGFTWLKCTVSETKCAYFAIFNEGLYEIYAERGGDTQENYDAAVKMLEQTLFLALAED